MSIAYVVPENKSGFQIADNKKIPIIKRNHYFVVNDVSVGGDAPKELLKVYEYKKVKASDKGKWPLYIVKTGHKWYPSESITEHLLNRVGVFLDLQMSESKIANIAGQIRFMSKYFLQENQILTHGAEIYAGHWQVDRVFMDTIEKKNLTKKVISVQLTKEALKSIYPQNWQKLLYEYTRMLLLDALIGNNDRHFYNWGVIEDISNNNSPYFAPIYDTARGLFWNRHENYIEKNITNPKAMKNSFLSYINKSSPKICWDGQLDINHFHLVKLLFDSEISLTKQNILDFYSVERINYCINNIINEFTGLFSQKRLTLIIKCLKHRHKIILDLLVK